MLRGNREAHARRAVRRATHGDVSGNLVAEALRGDDSNLIADTLVDLEVNGEAGVILLHHDAGGPLGRLGANATCADESTTSGQ